MNTQQMAYIGREACGCIVAMFLDMPGRREELATDLGLCILDGLTIERVPVEQARMTRCDAHPAPQLELPL